MSEQLGRILGKAGEVPEAGVDILNDVMAFLRRFCVFPDQHCLTAVTLWAAHTHMVGYFHTTPRLALLSPEAASGKTRVLEVLDLLVPDSLFTLNASPAAIFRSLAETSVTLLFDEVDAIWNKRGRDDNHEDLRALLNAGYKRGATIPRCVGPRHEVINFPVYCPVALAGLGELPDTIMSRSVIIRMRRRAPTERVEPFRLRQHEVLGYEHRDRLKEWAQSVGEHVGQAWPHLPDGIVDRSAEVWEPLIAVADEAGGQWPELARNAAIHLCKVAEDRHVSLGMRLLADLRTIFGKENKLATAAIIERLLSGVNLDDDAPWADLRGKAIDSRTVAKLLRPFNIRSRNIQVGNSRLKGYFREDLHDAWQRYLPPTTGKALQALHGLQGSNGTGSEVADEINVADTSATSEGPATSKGSNGEDSADVADVADIPSLEGECPRCDGEGCRLCDAEEVRL